MQVACLSPLPSHTLRTVFIKEFFFFFYFSFFGRTQQLCVSTCSSRWCQNIALLHSHDHVHLDLGYLGIKGLSSICGTHRFLLQSQHMRHHDAATMEMWAHRILPLTYFPVSLFVVLLLWLWGDVIIYLAGYIFCIIDCHICQNIFGSIDIIYCRLPYVSRGVLSLKTLILCIYRSRGTIQHNQ
jgi:hypothetical protein